MLAIGLEHYLVLSSLLFVIGMFAVLAKTNVITILMGIEIMFNAVNIAMVAFSRYITPTLLTGQIFAVFIIVVAAAEITLGLAIVIALYRARENIDVADASMLKG